MTENSQILAELQRLNHELRLLAAKIEGVEERQWHLYYEIVKVGGLVVSNPEISATERPAGLFKKRSGV